MQKVVFLLFFSFSIIPSVKSQFFDASRNWQRYRHEVYLGAGVSNYMGDLGGLDRKAVKVFLFDLEFSQFKNSFQGSHRYNISYRGALNQKLFYGKISGSDALTAQPQRNNRNLSFESRVISYSISYEYHILRSRPGHIYNLKGAKGTGSNPIGFYVFAGFGGFYYNPKAEYNGEMVELRKLGTEGQGIPGNPSKYKPFSICVPTGLGATLRLPFNLKLGSEFTYYFTFTDYLDDVSGFYFDNDLIREYNGDVAAAMADRSIGGPAGWTTAGAIRGNPKNNDGYLSLIFSLTYTFKSKKFGPQRPDKHPFLRK